MARILPPLLVALLLATVAVRCVLEPSRAEARDRILGTVQGGGGPEASRQLEAYLKQFDGPDDAWFACTVWFRIGKPGKAIAQIFDHPELAGQPDTARRFAESAFYAVGWEDEARRDATALEPFALIALNEGENAWAHERLTQHASTLDLLSSTTYFFPAFRRASHKPMETIVAAFRKRDVERFGVAAAMAASGAAPDAHRPKDRARLIKVVGDDKWRKQFREVWSASAFALGRLGGDAAVAALRKAAANLDGSPNAYDQQDQRLVYSALVAAGHWDVNEGILQDVFSETAVPIVTVWYLEALVHRYLAGDKNAEVWLRRMWEGPGTRFSSLRWRVARAFLLQDQIPSDDALNVWVGRMLHDLEAPGGPAVGHAIARAFRLRKGLPEAREQLLEFMRRAAEDFHTGPSATGGKSAPMIEALRALYLYG